MGLVEPPASAALGEQLIPCGHLAAVMSPGCVGARDAAYCTSPCWWRGVGHACMQNSFFLGLFSCNMALKISFPTLKEPAKYLRCLWGGIATLFFFFFWLFAHFQSQSCPFFFRTSYSPGKKKKETNRIICLRLRFTAASKI